MVEKEECKVCNGTGMLRDDEGWQYECSVCHGEGVIKEEKPTRVLSVDENNRLLD
jgi:DnaJ-class molecular chaperone